MALYTKCILKVKSPKDGLRISIMSRHTLNDGKTPDSRIKPESYDLIRPEFSPPAKLIGDYYKRGLSWEEFEERFREYIAQPEIATQLKELAFRALTENITLLCIEVTPERCHRRLVAEACKTHVPELNIEHC